MMFRVGRNEVLIEIPTIVCKPKILQFIGDESEVFLIFHNREHNNRHWTVLEKHCLEPYSSSFPQRDDRILQRNITETVIPKHGTVCVRCGASVVLEICSPAATLTSSFYNS